MLKTQVFHLKVLHWTSRRSPLGWSCCDPTSTSRSVLRAGPHWKMSYRCYVLVPPVASFPVGSWEWMAWNHRLSAGTFYIFTLLWWLESRYLIDKVVMLSKGCYGASPCFKCLGSSSKEIGAYLIVGCYKSVLIVGLCPWNRNNKRWIAEFDSNRQENPA